MSEKRDVARAMEEFLRLSGRRLSAVGRPSGTVSHLRAIRYPDGRTAYPELGILCAAQETLPQALARRKRQLVAKLFHQAMIPPAFLEWTFDSFPLEGGKRPAYDIARDYARRARPGNLLLVGPAGTGKTGLAVCILKARLQQGVPSLFASVPDLLDRIRATFDPPARLSPPSGWRSGAWGGYAQLMGMVKAVDFLVLDDLGAHHATAWAREKLFQILGYRHDWLLPTVITSDRPLAELELIVGRRTLARIVEHGRVVQIGGSDLRRRAEDVGGGSGGVRGLAARKGGMRYDDFGGTDRGPGAASP